MPRALITGIAGQDGHYLASLLHAKGYEVFGLTHRGPGPGAGEVGDALPFVRPVPGDVRDRASLVAALELAQPDEVYNLAAQSSVARSWSDPELTAEVNALGALRLLQAIRMVDRAGRIRFYQASSSEMYGRAAASPQDETTPFVPVHPYAVAKVFAHHATVTFRRAHGLFAVAGILFNHESPRRPPQYVTRKISRGVARIALGLDDHLVLGDLDVRRDWGYAPEYVEAMWLMLQQPEPEDYVVATGESRSVRDFLGAAFRAAGIEDWRPHVRRDPALLRPADVRELRGNAARAREALGWEPRTGFEDLARIMVAADLERERAARGGPGLAPGPALAPVKG